MNFSGWSNFEDFARACGYTNFNNNANNNSNNNSETNNFNNTGCYDIPNGFQCLNPELFVIIGTILGEIMAGNLPSNVQNALGNWFELLGQVILTYSAQQQYFQEGPGLYFNPKNYNINNQYCNTTQNSNSSKSNKESSKNNQNNIDKINELESRINDLIAEIEVIKNKINI